MDSEMVHKGKKAVRITIDKGDPLENGVKHIRSDEFEELIEKRELGPEEGKDYCYSFSLFLPKDFPIYPNKIVLAQWKQNEFYGIHSLNKAVLSLRYKAGDFTIVLETSNGKKILYSTDKEIRGKWLNFIFHLRFSRAEDGFVVVWLNKRQIIDFKGVTAHFERHSDKARFYFSLGLHKNKMDKAMATYFDEYSKHKLHSMELKRPRGFFGKIKS